MAVALGGRVAEELIFGPDDVTTGASNDFQQVRSRDCCGQSRSNLFEWWNLAVGGIASLTFSLV